MYLRLRAGQIKFRHELTFRLQTDRIDIPAIQLLDNLSLLFRRGEFSLPEISTGQLVGNIPPSSESIFDPVIGKFSQQKVRNPG